MSKPRCALALFMALVFGLSCAVPTEDLAETPYDESESLPFESIPVFYIAPALALLAITQTSLLSLPACSAAPGSRAATPRSESIPHAAGARAGLALRCALRC
jgi:hypothetical protein